MNYNEELIEKAITQSLANVSLESDFDYNYDKDAIRECLLGDEKSGTMGRLSFTRDSSSKK